MYIYSYISVSAPPSACLPCLPPPSRFQGYGLKYTVKGPQFGQTKAPICLSHKLFEESQNDSQRGENRILEIPDHPAGKPKAACAKAACFDMSVSA